MTSTEYDEAMVAALAALLVAEHRRRSLDESTSEKPTHAYTTKNGTTEATVNAGHDESASN